MGPPQTPAEQKETEERHARIQATLDTLQGKLAADAADRRIVRTALIDHLKAGRSVRFKPYGRSMEPHLKEGDIVTVMPRNFKEIRANDIVLCTVKDNVLLHFVQDIDYTVEDHKENSPVVGVYTIANAKGTVNGQIRYGDIHGIVTHVDASEPS